MRAWERGTALSASDNGKEVKSDASDVSMRMVRLDDLVVDIPPHHDCDAHPVLHHDEKAPNGPWCGLYSRSQAPW